MKPDGYTGFQFSYQTPRAEFGRARLGVLHTPHGLIETPNFIFCATRASIKAARPQDVREEGTQIILANTYHLHLRPGSARVAAFGGLHRFMGWEGPMLTDSGGFQVFSLGHGGVAEEIKGRRKSNALGKRKLLERIDEEGVTFRSVIDGTRLHMRPEDSIHAQRNLGADIILAFDECTPYHVSRSQTEAAMRRTHRWEDRSLTAFESDETYAPAEGSAGPQVLYGIVQGGVYENLRHESSAYVMDRPFFGVAVGGCLGGNPQEMRQVTRWAMAGIAPERPVHLLGIGEVADILDSVRMGIDTFDCVLPTRLARHGSALVRLAPRGRLNLRNATHRDSTIPLEEDCDCPACRDFSRGYLHHLVRVGEPLGGQLLTLHNVRFMMRLMQAIRQGLKTGTLEAVDHAWRPQARKVAD